MTESAGDGFVAYIAEHGLPPLAPAGSDNAPPWLQTMNPERSLRRFDLVHPTAEMVHFPTMARVLSRVPRFGGHTEGERIYSVAQHCVEGAYAIHRDGHGSGAAAAFLLHDGHEYITGDFATPIKQALAAHAEPSAAARVLKAIKSLQSTLDQAIYEAAGIDWPLPPAVAKVVREYDARMCRTERDARCDVIPYPWHSSIESADPVQGCDLSEWGASVAEGRFLVALREFGIGPF